jgi:hypothetical protein
MSQTIFHDKENNILHVSKTEDSSQVPPKVEIKKRELRGFIVTIAHTQEDLEAIQAGDHTKMQLAPIMAPEEQDAVNLIAEQGKIPLSVVSYEYLKFQTSLLEELSQQEQITLLTSHVFRAEAPKESN